MGKPIIETLVINAKAKGQTVFTFDISEITSGICKSLMLDLRKLKDESGKWITEIEIESV